MQKKIIALAVAGLVSGAAFAQSNVTVYGVADVTFDRVQATGASGLLLDTAGTGDVVKTISDLNWQARNRVSANSSHIGFKGTESLGGGMNAVFQLESTVGIDSATGITLNRDSFVGLNGGFGTVVLGNLTGPTRGLGAAMDINAGATGIGANSALLGKMGGATFIGVNPYYAWPATAGDDNTLANAQANLAAFGYCSAASATCASIFDTRWTNAIAYVSPNFGGVSITAAYVANENKTRQDVASKLNTWGYDVGVRYEAGPILVGLTQNQARIGDNASTKATDTRFAARYNFGMGTVGLVYDRVRAQAGAGAFGDPSSIDMKRNAWLIPVTFNVGAGKIIAQYGQAGDVSGSSDTGAKMLAAGYEHSLSKRTMLKAVYSQIRNEAGAYYDFGVNSVGGIFPGADPKGFQVGVRHSF